MAAAEIRKRRIESMRSSRWQWHLDEMFVKINGERLCLGSGGNSAAASSEQWDWA